MVLSSFRFKLLPQKTSASLLLEEALPGEVFTDLLGRGDHVVSEISIIGLSNL